MRCWLTLFVLIAGACSSLLPPEPPPTPEPPTPVENADCGIVCARGKTLGCDWASPTPQGTPCPEWCEGVQAGLLPWDLECRAAAGSCRAMDACER